MVEPSAERSAQAGPDAEDGPDAENGAGNSPGTGAEPAVRDHDHAGDPSPTDSRRKAGVEYKPL